MSIIVSISFVIIMLPVSHWFPFWLFLLIVFTRLRKEEGWFKGRMSRVKSLSSCHDHHQLFRCWRQQNSSCDHHHQHFGNLCPRNVLVFQTVLHHLFTPTLSSVELNEMPKALCSEIMQLFFDIKTGRCLWKEILSRARQITRKGKEEMKS